MASKGQRFRKYSLEEKMKIIQEVVEEGKSTGYLSNVYGISRNTIDTWVYQYKRGNQFDKPRGRVSNQEIDYQQRYEILKEFSAFLDKQHKTK
jgi:transposase-like protein